MTTSLMVYGFISSLNSLVSNEKKSNIDKESLETKIDDAFKDFVKEVVKCHYKKEKSLSLVKEANNYKQDVIKNLDKIIENTDNSSISKGSKKV